MGRKTESAVGFLNGLVGDRLARGGNGLATVMTLALGDRPLPVEAAALRAALPEASGGATDRIVLLVHGLFNTESVWRLPDGDDLGARLRRDLGLCPLYLRYNTGLPIADNGAALDALLERVVAAWPVAVRELVLLGYSMGGLMARAACHAASERGSPWLPLVRRAVYVGTPHEGAPLERLGRAVSRALSRIDDPYTQLLGRIAELRSDGVKDLGDADLRHQDRLGRRAQPDRARRGPRLSLRDRRHPVPLLPGIEHFLVAGTLGAVRDAPGLRDLFGLFPRVVGDALVPVPSGTAVHHLFDDGAGIPADHVTVLPRTSHLALPRSPQVYQQIRAWLEERP